MVTVIDALIVELGLDPGQFTKGQEEAVNSAKTMEEAYDKQTKAVEASSKKQALSLQGVRNQVLLLLAAFTAGSGLKSFYQQMTNTDAAAGRMANNIGMSVDRFTAWQNVAARSGGTAEGIAGSFRGLSQEFQNLALTGQSSVIPYFRALGVQIADGTGHVRSFDDLMLDLADRFSKLDPARAQAFGRGLGLDEGTVNVLMKGREAVSALLKEQEKLGYANKEDARAAIARQQALERLKQVSEDLGRKFLTALTPAILMATDALEKLGKWFRENPEAAKIAIGSLTAAVGILTTALAVTGVAAWASWSVAALAAIAPVAAALLPVAAAAAAVYTKREPLTNFYNQVKDYAQGKITTKEFFGSPADHYIRGIRNNNPGNLKFAGQAGAEHDEKGFAVFKSMDDGLRALARQLQIYDSRHINTVKSIIEKYAPAGDGNKTDAYINNVAKKLGVGPNAVLNIKDQEVLRTLMKAITDQEIGTGHIYQKDIDRAIGAGNPQAGVTNSSRSSSITVGQLTIKTNATDARGIARDFIRQLSSAQDVAMMANYGLS